MVGRRNIRKEGGEECFGVGMSRKGPGRSGPEWDLSGNRLEGVYRVGTSGSWLGVEGWSRNVQEGGWEFYCPGKERWGMVRYWTVRERDW